MPTPSQIDAPAILQDTCKFDGNRPEDGRQRQAGRVASLQPAPQPSRYQLARSQVLLSQPLSSATSLSFTAATPSRATTGITATLLTANSFSLISREARLIGSSSTWAALWVSSYSWFCQRVMLRPCHLLALVATSHEQNWRRNISGSGWLPLLYICRSQ